MTADPVRIGRVAGLEVGGGDHSADHGLMGTDSVSGIMPASTSAEAMTPGQNPRRGGVPAPAR